MRKDKRRGTNPPGPLGALALKYWRALSAVVLLSASASGGPLSFTGTLSTPQSVFDATFTLASSSAVTFHTWGFGGGVNANGQAIAAGGFDSLIVLFSGPVATATVYTDGSGNPLADADNLLNSPWSFVGNCPPAGTVSIGGANDCGDVLMQTVLAARTYTLTLSDANYIPNAIYDNGALSEGFTDFTGGVFQTCDPGANACIAPNGNYALDILATAPLTETPEPAPLCLPGIGFAAYAVRQEFRKRRSSPNPKGATK